MCPWFEPRRGSYRTDRSIGALTRKALSFLRAFCVGGLCHWLAQFALSRTDIPLIRSKFALYLLGRCPGSLNRS